MRNIEEFKDTTNRSVYNKSRKHYLNNSGELRCSHCPYHSGENDDKNWYFYSILNEEIFPHLDRYPNLRRGPYFEKSKIPNWKLVSKNPKQWMDKPIKLKRFDYAFEIKF